MLTVLSRQGGAVKKKARKRLRKFAADVAFELTNADRATTISDAVFLLALSDDERIIFEQTLSDKATRCPSCQGWFHAGLKRCRRCGIHNPVDDWDDDIPF
jgi:hypothetical protein